jgi:gliding motility-associated-like protein
MIFRLFLSVPIFYFLIFSGSGFAFNNQETPAIDIPHSMESEFRLPDCNNWLYLPSHTSLVSVGDLDIPGNQVTVEALYMRTAPYSGVDGHAGDIVSKHFDLNDVNYLLRPSHAEITTTNGFFRTQQICPLELNKVYHIAMVYNGSSLKFYRNGLLMSEVAVSGNMILNNWNTRIGLYSGGVSTFQFLGYINEVRIWNVARTQAEICEFMQTSLPSPASQSGLQAYYTFDNLLNKQGNAAWNGMLVGNAVINQTNAFCPTYVADSCGISVDTHDFTYRPDLCNPLTVQFSTAGNPIPGNWSFGDGNTATGVASISHTYAGPGNYTVTFTPQTAGCPKSTTKNINIAVVTDNIILTNDTAICDGVPKQLRTVPSLSFCWSPTTYLDNPNSPNPITSTPHDITYYFNALVPGITNLITNGNFSAGNTGFTSQYTYTANNVTEAQYYIGTSPRAWNANLDNCGDHTTGTGNMMLVNGSPVLDAEVWRQTITVLPNTNYAFSTWIQALGAPNPSQLQFSINGQTVGNLITATLPTCTWSQFYATWNSGTATSAIISIVNKNLLANGNDFALDDIFFSQVIVKRDSIAIRVNNPAVKTSNDTTICAGTGAQLNTTGAQAYSWTPATGLSNTTIANPVANPQSSTQYIVTGTTASGCTAKDTVVVSTHLLPTIAITGDTAICRNASVPLLVSGGVSYSWSPSATLNNASVPNPVASPSAETTYRVQITDANTCTHEDSVTVGIRPRPAFAVSPNQPVCEGSTVTLVATGGETYAWSPPASLSDDAIPNPVASPAATTQYSVYVSESQCNYDTTMQVTVTVNPNPTIVAEKSNDITCSTPTAQLTASGASTYLWSPAEGLDFPDIYNPKASIDTTTVFWVTGTNQFGCSNVDSVHVKVTADNKPFFLLPNAFSPNNDGYNDCFGIRNWGAVTLLEFSIYNRWGEKIFSTINPAQCWDGRYKGKVSDIGAYAFVVRARSICGEIKRTGTVLLVK